MYSCFVKNFLPIQPTAISTLFPSRRSSDLYNLGSALVWKGEVDEAIFHCDRAVAMEEDRKSTRLNSSHSQTSYAVFCLKKKKRDEIEAGKSYCSRRFGGATCDDKSAQIYAR